MTAKDWRTDALCQQFDPDMFFPIDGGSSTNAKWVCARCPVAAPCLELGMDMVDGVYGGMSANDRRKLRAKARRVA